MKKLSKRALATLKDSAREYQGKQLGTNVLNNGLVAYKLEDMGLVTIRHTAPGSSFAFATQAGKAYLLTL